MASNSLASILEKMKSGSITEKWGAVCAFDRERLNRVLQQQWIEKYDGTQYLPVFSGQMDLNDSRTEFGVLKDVLLGKPLLSFEPAALDNSRAVLTLSILGGTFTANEIDAGVLYSYTITEAQGYTLKVVLDLSLVVGVVDRLGRVTLDLSKGTQFMCNLAGPAASQKKLGEFFNQRFQELPLERQVYELGILDLKGGSDLTPTNFIVLTQRAPGAELAGAANSADGAVVVLVQLRGSPLGGDIPSKDYFPYLIPDDEENGVKKYSATLVLAREYVSRSDDEKLELIRSLLFPGEKNVFVEHSRHVPYDMVSFGSLDPSRTTITIEPWIHSLKAGAEPLQYRALRDGMPVTGVTWSVSSLNTNGSSGQIDPASGLYRPVSAQAIGKDSVRNIVTASYVDPVNNQTHRVSALLLVTPEAMTVSPGYVSRHLGDDDKVTFVATALSGSTLTWSTPEYGSLVATGNTAVYTPPAKEAPFPDNFVLQTIEVRDQTGETVQACVMLSKFDATLAIDPPFVSSLARSATVTLKDLSDDVPVEFERRWQVLGEGSVVDGVFTAPANPIRAFSAVKCEIWWGTYLVKTGFSVVRLSNIDVEASWTELTRFSLSALRSTKAFANGYQQLPLEARIETDGARLTKDEENSLKLVYVGSNQEVEAVPALQLGIEYDPGGLVRWAQTREENRFKPFPGVAAQAEPDEEARAELPNRVNLFVVTRASQPEKFYAQFTRADGVPKRSDVHPGAEDGIIELVPEPAPTPVLEDYTLSRRRVAGGSGPGGPDTNDDFDWHLNTTDYWDLSYKRGGTVGVTFETADVAGLNSIVQWESTFENERMFSYTGFAYNNPLLPGDQNLMKYDFTLTTQAGMAPSFLLKTDLEQPLAEGRFLIGLFRRDDVLQSAKSGLTSLKRSPMRVVLTDNEGNRHALAVRFESSDRNRLKLGFLDE